MIPWSISGLAAKLSVPDSYVSQNRPRTRALISNGNMPVRSPLSSHVLVCLGQKRKMKSFGLDSGEKKKKERFFFNPLEGKIHYVELYHIKENMIKIAWYEYSSVTWQEGGSTESDGSTLLTESSFRDHALKECVMRFAGLNYGSLLFSFCLFLFF